MSSSIRKKIIFLVFLSISFSCERDELDELMHRREMLVRGIEEFELSRHEMQKSMCFIFSQTSEKLNNELYASVTRDWKTYAERLKENIENIKYDFDGKKNNFSLVNKANTYFKKLKKTINNIGKEKRSYKPKTSLDSIEHIVELKKQEKQSYLALKKEWLTEVSKAKKHIENLEKSVEIAQSYYTVLKTTSMRQRESGAKNNLFDLLQRLRYDILELRNFTLKIKCLIDYKNETDPNKTNNQNENYLICNGLFPDSKKREINTELNWVLLPKNQFKCTKKTNLNQNGTNRRK